MQVHVKKGKISQENITKLSTIMSTGSKQRGKTMQKNKGGKQKKGRFRKWCPIYSGLTQANIRGIPQMHSLSFR